MITSYFSRPFHVKWLRRCHAGKRRRELFYSAYTCCCRLEGGRENEKRKSYRNDGGDLSLMITMSNEYVFAF
jgi:hypothetical protein